MAWPGTAPTNTASTTNTTRNGSATLPRPHKTAHTLSQSAGLTMIRFNHRGLARRLPRALPAECHPRLRLPRALRTPSAFGRSVPKAAAFTSGRVVNAIADSPGTVEEYLKDARRMARDFFGIDRLRPEQERLIANMMVGENTIIDWPHFSGRATAGYLVWSCLCTRQ